MPSPAEMAGALAIAVVLLAFTIAAAAMGSGSAGGKGDGVRSGPMLFQVLMNCMVFPICEELLFRDALPRLLARWSRSWIATLSSAMLFAAVHIGAGWAAWTGLCLGALILSFAYARTHNLAVPIMAHILLNATVTAVLAVR